MVRAKKGTWREGDDKGGGRGQRWGDSRGVEIAIEDGG